MYPKLSQINTEFSVKVNDFNVYSQHISPNSQNNVYNIIRKDGQLFFNSILGYLSTS